MNLTIGKSRDFEIIGKESAAWANAPWHALSRVGNGKSAYESRFKVLYSAKGLYFLFFCEDQQLTCTIKKDNQNIFTEDVIEVFLWPYEPTPTYFEYEISPLNKQLPIMVNNHEGAFHGWLPFHPEDPARTVLHATSVQGGPKRSMAKIESWMCEFFLPFGLMRGLGNAQPKAGTIWRANMYRIDYDKDPTSQWAWCTKTGGNFHNYKDFGTVTFE